MTRRRFGAAVGAAMVGLPYASGIRAEEPAGPPLDAIRTRHQLPGLVAGVVERDGLADAVTAGVRRQGGDAAFSVDDRIHLGSCTKAFTATLAALLVADGRIAWGATVGSTLAAEPVISRGWRDVTLEELLRHRGGAPEKAPPAAWREAWECGKPAHECREAFVRRLLADDPPERRGEHHYSNQGYAIAGRMLETVADRPYEALLGERLLVPLGITSAGFGPPSALQPDAPVGHDGAGKPDDADNPAAIAPAGTLHMTVADWARFLAVHLGGPLPEALAALAPLLPDLQRPSPTPPGEALGWVTARRPWGGRVLNHAGSNTRWYCVAWLAPERGFGVVAAANQGGAAATKGCDDACAALIAARRG
ncbi:MAG: beta-lactamase family protein [Planctomycetes bacterium]|nr:beta-lactamase family protein [Planctomycetota bacterium]